MPIFPTSAHTDFVTQVQAYLSLSIITWALKPQSPGISNSFMAMTGVVQSI
ncbi:MAG: hypothetical protein CM15mP130_0470 [Verrucomicrobiota bacterium]|nr:MAG: hypothetical protein CM15mP130_0470 [Verrucomicrobiota bacterium]